MGALERAQELADRGALDGVVRTATGQPLQGFSQAHEGHARDGTALTPGFHSVAGGICLAVARMTRARAPVLVATCVAAAALSLLAPWALAFDPQVWVMWGRDALALSLTTDDGPSWKPLPVVITTALAPAGDGAQMLWLVVARAGALLALAAAWVLGRRLSGRTAGALAVLVILASPWWLLHSALGNSEGLLAAGVLWAGVAHGHRRYGVALALGLAVGLLRPEAWPFLLAYGIWLWRAQPALRGAAAAALAALVALWLLPDVLGGGGAVRAAGTARGTASPGAAQHAAIPGWQVLVDAVGHLTLPGLAALAAAVLPWRSVSAPVRAPALAALAYVALVAVATQAGYAGNPRYLVPATAVGAVLAGVGVARVARSVPGGIPVALVAFAVAVIALRGPAFAGDVRELGWRAGQRTALDAAVARAGGVPALRACGTVRTAHLTRGLVAWRFGLGLRGMNGRPAALGVLLRSQPRRGAALEPRVPPRYARAAGASGWEIWTLCGPRTMTPPPAGGSGGYSESPLNRGGHDGEGESRGGVRVALGGDRAARRPARRIGHRGRGDRPGVDAVAGRRPAGGGRGRARAARSAGRGRATSRSLREHDPRHRQLGLSPQSRRDRRA